ncbi:MAG: hypothetical protein LBJ78_00365 [Puniceicoccales bacterium]|jgi:hypothetical protein|nr:hypothetical protein [Puniceicoccales bacterium]
MSWSINVDPLVFEGDDVDYDTMIRQLPQGLEPTRYLASGRDISAFNTIREFGATFYQLFNDIYKPMLRNLVTEFNAILNLGKSSPTPYEFNSTTLSLDANLILEENDLSINCKEGQYAYQYYVECTVRKLNDLNNYIKYANESLLSRLEFMKNNNATMLEAQVVIDQLKMCDAIVFERIRDFSGYHVLKTDSRRGEYAEYWEEEFAQYFISGTPYTSPSKIGTLSSYSNLAALRQLKVTSPVFNITPSLESWVSGEKQLTSFNELTLLDKLKYICIYYKLNLGTDGESRFVFPDDAEIGYPCAPNEVIDDTKEIAIDDTKELGALELFYIGYLIDRDGPVNALSSFLAVKTQALRANITTTMNRIIALKNYLSFMRKALELLNVSQAKGGGNRLPDAAYWAITYVGGGVIRNLMELKDAHGNYLKDSQGNEIRDPFIVIQDKGTETSDKYHLTTTNRYLLVKATEEGFNALLGDSITGTGNSANSNGMDYTFDRTFLHTATWSGWSGWSEWNGMDGLIRANHLTLPAGFSATIDGTLYTGTLPTTCLPTALQGAQYSIYDKFSYVSAVNTNSKTITIDTYDSDRNIYLLQLNDQEQAKQYLPKEIKWYPMDAKPLGYIEGSMYWRNKDKEGNQWPHLVDAWTSTINTIVENLESCIEGINNEISTLRSKVDTLDSASSTFRKRVSGIYRSIIGNIE